MAAACKKKDNKITEKSKAAKEPTTKYEINVERGANGENLQTHTFCTSFFVQVKIQMNE